MGMQHVGAVLAGHSLVTSLSCSQPGGTRVAVSANAGYRQRDAMVAAWPSRRAAGAAGQLSASGARRNIKLGGVVVPRQVAAVGHGVVHERGEAAAATAARDIGVAGPGRHGLVRVEGKVELLEVVGDLGHAVHHCRPRRACSSGPGCGTTVLSFVLCVKTLSLVSTCQCSRIPPASDETRSA